MLGRSRRAAAFVLFLLVASLAASRPGLVARRPRASGLRPRAPPRAALARDRAVPRRAHEGGDRRARPARPLLHRRRERRRVEDDRLRPHLAADLRRPADGLDRRARRRRRRTRTSSTSAAARACSGPTSRRATASTGRPTPAAAGATSACATGSRSRRSSWTRSDEQAALRRGARPSRTARTRSAGSSARRDGGLSVREGALPRRGHGRGRRGARPSGPERRLRRALGGAAGAVGERRVHGPGSGLYKSTDGGTHLAPARRRACPAPRTGLGRIGITVAPSDSAPPLATVEAQERRRASTARTTRARAGRRVNADPRVVARPDDAAEVRVHPTDPDIALRADDRDVEVDGRRRRRSRPSAARPAATTTSGSGSTPTAPR